MTTTDQALPGWMQPEAGGEAAEAAPPEDEDAATPPYEQQQALALLGEAEARLADCFAVPGSSEPTDWATAIALAQARASIAGGYATLALKLAIDEHAAYLYGGLVDIENEIAAPRRFRTVRVRKYRSLWIALDNFLFWCLPVPVQRAIVWLTRTLRVPGWALPWRR